MSAPEQRPAHRFRCGPLVAFQRMPVHVLGDGNAGMTEHLGDDVQRRPLGQHQRGARMPQLVRMPMPQASPLARVQGTTVTSRMGPARDISTECPGRTAQ